MADEAIPLPRDPQWAHFFASWTPEEAATFFLENPDDPDMVSKDWWLVASRLPLLRKVREDRQLWQAVCTLSERAFLGRKRLENLLDSLARLAGTDDQVAHPAESPPPDLEMPAPALPGLLRTAKGEVRESINNFATILDTDPAWKGRLTFDHFFSRPCLDGTPLDDPDITPLGIALANQYRLTFRSKAQFREALYAVALAHPTDALRDYLAGLAWDGTPRLDDWLFRCGQAELSPLNVWIGRVLLVQAVARALEPGCQARLVGIFKSAQGMGKTQAVLVLGGDWGKTFDMSLDTKEAQLALRGLWFAELGELDTMSRARESRMNSFITIQVDHLVKKYENEPSDFPRRTVFIGTTNDEEFLPAGEDNTRYLPIRTGQWDLALLAQWRDQLFAEAQAFYRQHLHDWWRIPEGLEVPLADLRLSFQHSAAYEHAIERWMASQPGTDYTMADILQSALGIEDKSKWTRSKEMEVGKVLRKMGYASVRARERGTGALKRYWRFVPEKER